MSGWLLDVVVVLAVLAYLRVFRRARRAAMAAGPRGRRLYLVLRVGTAVVLISAVAVIALSFLPGAKGS